MARILWLDNNPDEVYEDIEDLAAAGHDVWPVRTEAACIEALRDREAPNLLIQDLHRPDAVPAQVDGGAPRTSSVDPYSAGWHFYAEVLKPHFPEVPVLVFSADATHERNTLAADDFNIEMLQKGLERSATLTTLASNLIERNRTVVRRAHDLPALHALDFATVNQALFRHLVKHPTDIDLLNWSTFEHLVERLLAELGYEVHRTKLSWDGGLDLWALQKTELGEILYVIDAKKYPRNKIVGPTPVRAIHGVRAATNASVGMIVTTGRFGPSARALAAQHRFQLSLKQYDDVIAWIRDVSS